MSEEVIRRDTLAAFEKALDDAAAAELSKSEKVLDAGVAVELSGFETALDAAVLVELDGTLVPPEAEEPEVASQPALPSVLELQDEPAIPSVLELASEPAIPSAPMVPSELAIASPIVDALELELEPEPRHSGAERRSEPRYSLVEPAVVAVSSWSELVALYTKDISCGGMFVETDAPPERDSRVAVQLQLPHGAGTLEFEGIVVHVVTLEQAQRMRSNAGFGIQFTDLSPDRRRSLQQLVDQAKLMEAGRAARATALSRASTPARSNPLAEAERRQLAEMRAVLATMTASSDLEVLGLRSPTDRNALRHAFERLARLWHPSVAHVQGSPEVRRLAGEIFLRVHESYRRLRDALAAIEESAPHEPASLEPVEPVPPRRSRAASARAVPDASDVGPPPVEAPPFGSSPAEERRVHDEPRGPGREAERVDDGSRGRSTTSAAELAARSEQIAALLKRRAPGSKSAPTPAAKQGPVDEVLRLVAEKRYVEAIERLEQVLQRAPTQRLRVLLCIVQARQAITERNLPKARACYEAVLELDPDNEVAKRELLMLSAVLNPRT